MYLRALAGYKRVVGLDHPRSRGLQDSLRTLDTITENKTLQDVDKLLYNSWGGVLGLGAKGDTLKTKRYKLLKNLA
jgi:hypothetical protein